MSRPSIAYTKVDGKLMAFELPADLREQAEIGFCAAIDMVREDYPSAERVLILVND